MSFDFIIRSDDWLLLPPELSDVRTRIDLLHLFKKIPNDFKISIAGLCSSQSSIVSYFLIVFQMNYIML